MNTEALETRCSLAGVIAREGYRVALAMQKERLPASLKGIGGGETSFVTAADIAVEQMMTRAIRGSFPDDLILGEEGEGHGGLGDTRGRFVWVNDPVDGTGNYSRGIFPWAVSSAVLFDGIPVVAAVVVEGELYATHAALPHVFKDGVPLPPISARPQKEWVISYECFERLREGHTLARALWDSTHSNRGLSSSIGQCIYVIDRRIDGFAHARLSIFDHAPTALLVEKAGGLITRWDGAPLFPEVWERTMRDFKGYLARPYRYDMLAAPRTVHETLLAVMKPYARECEGGK